MCDLETAREKARDLHGSAREWLRKMPEDVRADRQVVLTIVQKDGLALEWAARALQSDKEVVLAAVKKGAFALQFASPSLLRDRLFVLAAVQCNGYALACAGKFQGDREIVQTAVREDGSALEYASDALKRDREIALTAARWSDAALEYVAESLWQDRSFTRAVLEKNDAAWEYASEKLQADRRFLLEVLQINPGVFRRLQPGQADAELILKVIKATPAAFEHLPAEMRDDQEFLLRAFAANCQVVEYVPSSVFADSAFLLRAVELEPKVLASSPPEARGSKDIVTKAVQRNPAALQHASDSLRMSEKFVLSLLKKDAVCLQYCSDELRCHEGFNLEAISKNPEAHHYVRAELWQDEEFVLEALSIEVSVLELVPESVLCNRAIALKAVETTGQALKYLDLGFRDDRQVVLTAVEDDASALAFASERLRADTGLFRASLKVDGLALEHADSCLQDDPTWVLEATQAGPNRAAAPDLCPFRFASQRIRQDPDFVWQVAAKVGAVVLAHSPLRGDAQFVSRLTQRIPDAIQYADEKLLDDLPYLLSIIRQSPAVLNFVPEELRASASFVLASVRGNGAAVDYAPRRFQTEPEFLRAADSAFPSRHPLDHEALEKRGIPLARLGGAGTLSAAHAGNRIAQEWDRLDHLSPRGLRDECEILGLPGAACLEWYGASFLLIRFKKLHIWREMQLQELKAESDAKGVRKAERPVGRADSHTHPQGPDPTVSLHVGACISVLQDLYSVSNLKLKSGLQGTVVSIDKGGDARIDFNIETFAGGLNATQWVYKKDFDKLSVDKDDELLNSMLNELTVDQFAGFYERSGVPVRDLGSFAAANAVTERWDVLAKMSANELAMEFTRLVGIEPDAKVELEAQLRSAAVWEELPLTALFRECARRKLAGPLEATSFELQRAELWDRLLGTLCKDLYLAIGLDLKLLVTTKRAAALYRRWCEIDELPSPTLQKEYATFDLPKVAEKEQRTRVKKVAYWDALPFNALREECWNMGMRSAYFNSADFHGRRERLIREAIWFQWAPKTGGQTKMPSDARGWQPPPREQAKDQQGRPNCPFEYMPPPPQPMVPMHIRQHLQTLLLPPNASLRDVKAAYKKLALKYHPDKNSKDMEDLVTQRFTEIRSAYDELLSYFDEPG